MNKSEKELLKIFTQRKKCIERYRATMDKQREKDKKRKTIKATIPKIPKEKKEPKVKEPKVKEPKAKQPKAKKMSDSLEKI